MKQLISYFCLLALSVMTVSCDKIFGEDLTDLIFDYGVIEVPDKALFIGNSLLLGNGTFGMNATDSLHDYHALIQARFLAANPAYTDVKLSGIAFEGCENHDQQLNWLENTLRPQLSADLDLVVIQIGDNVNTSKRRSAFEQGAKELIATIREASPNAHVVWLYGWYVSSNVTKSIKNACKQYTVNLVAINDIHKTENESSIGTVVTRTAPTSQTLNYTRYTVLPDGRLQIDFAVEGKNYTAMVRATGYDDNPGTKTLTWQGYETITTDWHVASHPGNSGFAQIARHFFEMVNITWE